MEEDSDIAEAVGGYVSVDRPAIVQQQGPIATIAARVVGRLRQAVPGAAAPVMDAELSRDLDMAQFDDWRYKTMGGLVQGAATDDERRLFQLLETRVPDAIRAQAAAHIAEQEGNRAVAPWERFAPKRFARFAYFLGEVRHHYGDWQMIRGIFSPRQRLEWLNAQTDLDKIQAANDFAAVPLTLQEVMRQQSGELNPRLTAYDLADLRTQAEATHTAIPNPNPPAAPAPNPNLTVQQLLEALVGEALRGGSAKSLYARVLSSPQNRAYLEEKYREVYQGDTAETAQALAEVDTPYLAEMAYLRTQKRAMERYEAGWKLVREIQNHESERSSAETTRENAARARAGAVAPEVAAKAMERELAATEKRDLTIRSIALSHARYEARYTTEIASRAHPAFDTLPVIVNSPGNPNHGSIDSIALEAIGGGLQNQFERRSIRYKRATEEPYGPGNRPHLAARFSSLADLKAKQTEAKNAHAAANQAVQPSAIQKKPMTCQALLMDLHVRQLRAQNMPEDTCYIQGAIGTAMELEQAESRIPEARTVRQVRQLTKGRLALWAERARGLFTRGLSGRELDSSHRRFRDFARVTLKFEQIQLDSSAQDIIGWIQAGELDKDQLSEMIDQVEMLGRDRTEGADLTLYEQVHPLHFNLRVARRTLGLVDVARDFYQGDNPDKLDLLRDSLLRKVPVPRLGRVLKTPHFETAQQESNRVRLDDHKMRVEAARELGEGVEQAEEELQYMTYYLGLPMAQKVMSRAWRGVKKLWNRTRDHWDWDPDSDLAGATT